MLYATYQYQMSNSRTSVSSDMFGVNTLIHRDNLGDTGKLPETIDKIDATVLRYPGGTVTEEFFDLSNPNKTTGTSRFTGKLESDLLPLSDFLSYAAQADKEVLLVLPTFQYFDPVTRGLTPGAEAEVRSFIRNLLSGVYGQASISGLEIGNEWYQDRFTWSAVEFGRLQAKMADWVNEEAGRLNIDVPIFVQAGRGDDDGNGIQDNLELASAFDQNSIAAVDGLISHVYIATSSTDPMILGGSVADRFTSIDTAWSGRFGRSFSQVVTEWNVGESGPTTSTINGLMRSAPLLKLFATMVNSGVDLASIWTAQNSSPAALAGPESGTSMLTPTGLLFRMLASYLPGTEMNPIDSSSVLKAANGSSIGYCYSFVDDGRTVLVVSSGVNDTVSVTMRVAGAISSASHVFGLLLGAPDGDTGTQFRSNGQIEIRSLGELEGSVAGDGMLDVLLAPFETIMIVVSNGTPVTIEADPQSSVSDNIIGSDFHDTLKGYLGDDTIHGMAGDDEISLGQGRDVAYGGAGDDKFIVEDDFASVDGGAGSDLLDLSLYLKSAIYIGPDGRLSDDSAQSLNYSSVERLVGTIHADSIYAFEALSFIDSGEGDDFIFISRGDGKFVIGGDGDDRITSRTDYNTLVGGAGNDRLYVSGSYAIVDGGLGNDRVIVTGASSLVRDSEGDDFFVFTDSYGLTADFTAARGDNVIFGFNPSVHRFLLDVVQIANSTITQVVDASGNSSLSIAGDDFSILLVGIQQLPSEYFQQGVGDWF